MRSDDWDFPTNKFPNIGWLGRVHRGTPWQTVYLKSPVIDVTNWVKWTGNIQTSTNFGQISTSIVPLTNRYYDVVFTYPTNDWAMMDLFTTAFNDNATRGRVPINQTNLPAWSALFSGVIALQAKTNAVKGVPSTTNLPVVIEPVGLNGTNSPLWQLYAAINDVRRTNFAGSFRKLGDILAVPQFSVDSPFLKRSASKFQDWSANDAAVERLPQQVFSLIGLDKSPRFLVYSWGQSLKPANRSIVTSGQFFGLCTNYQVTAETATRTVLRLDGLPDNPHIIIEKFNVMPPD
jgi:hypothetical protein